MAAPAGRRGGGLRVAAAAVRGVVRDRRGVVATEFALVVPLLFVMLAGIVEVSEMLLLSSRVVAAAQTGADLVSRDTCLDDGEIADVFQALTLVLDPYPDTGATYDLASVEFDPDDGSPAVEWRDLRNIPEADDRVLADDVIGLGGPGESVVVGTVTYTYQPIFAGVITGAVTFSESAVFRPRITTAVRRTADDCP